jgi:hypothetical protein
MFGQTEEMSVKVVEGGRKKRSDSIEKCNPEHAYSMNESAHFYRIQPGRTISNGP